jgi:hypothetical protein
MNKQLVSTIGGLALSTVMVTYHTGLAAAPVLSTAAPVAAALPCETQTTSPPPTQTLSAPQNVRIISGGSGGDELEPDDNTTSGPYVEDTEPVDDGEPAMMQTTTHGYYLTLAGRADCLRAYSLRDPAQLAAPVNGGFAHSSTRPLVVTYDPTHDPDPRRQDAAKVPIDTSSNSLSNQIHLPIPTYSGPLLVTWDAWFGREFAYGTSGIPTYKNFQLASGGAIWTEVRSRFSAATSGNVALVDLRYYGMPGPGFFVGNMDALSPMVGSFQTAPETWTRYWVYLKPAGTYTELSMWVADANRNPVQILDRALVTPRSGLPWDEFWLEYNTSTDQVKAGRPTLVSYVRNVVMLSGLTSVSTLLQRP